ncbi:TetR/AcrR family transcriptional regulator C-terminal domain-containing protein [Paenibacillus agricola]|uniref:TetR/AcrR family transcriptional regulator n=1 Tax=Paenibacillus agricola TaxID=2716264 RepID=A0ABX0J4T3_9BACL|nr:TetR/AcrR family transcriptional regulator C-terminal domain-containing protein [Paenibacillus agricola]NHN30831.1 TetR/AcrR family transcriptional regulator [Paenibacillus agricola]
MSERTKHHIQQAFYTLLKTTYFSDITVQDICDQARIHRSTFYRYYNDKYVLLNIVVEGKFKDMHSTLPLSESKTTIVAHIIDYFEDNMSFFKHITAENSDYLYESLDQFISQMLLQNASKYEDALSQKIHNAKHPELLSNFYSSGIRKILKKWVIDPDDQYTKDDIIEFFVYIVE